MNLRKVRVPGQKYFPTDTDISIWLNSCMKIKYQIDAKKSKIEIQINGTQLNKTQKH